MDPKAELRLPTVAVPVRLALVGHPPVDAELFMSDVPRHGRSELLDDVAALLEQPVSFVPIRFDAGVRMLGKHAIAWIAVRRHDDEGDGDFDDIPSEVLTLYDRQHRVEVELIAGDKLTGMLLDSSPADRPRVVDHLNHAVHFVRLWTSDDHYLINKTQILQVAELSWSRD